MHSTQKPEEMLYRIIAITSKKGDVVLDPFGGTMTTAAAAKKLGRDYIMIERDKSYCGYGQKRLDDIEYQDSDIANAVFDEKPLKVSVTEMIEAKALSEGEWFYFKTGKAIAKLCADGKLDYNGAILDMHTCAAVARNVKANRLSGFDYWYVKRNDVLVSIDEVRNEYRNKLKLLSE